MSEWSTYTLADLLMFSSRSYYRLIAQYNEAIWPAHLLAIAAGLVLLGCIARPGIRPQRVALGVLAVAWAWVGWAYHWQRYAEINTAAPYFAAAFALQAVLLCCVAPRPAQATPVAIGMTGLAVLAYPMLALVTGRGWSQAEVFAIAPDPTALATLAILLACRARWFAWPIPLAWCVVSGATLCELHVGHAWLLPVLAAVIVLANWRAVSSTTSRRS